MTPLNLKPPTRQGAAAAPPPNPGYAPSVPISVYRELAAELQAARTQLDTLNQQNQQLTRQNQQLRLEIERVVQTALHLRQVADSFPPMSRGITLEAPQVNLEVKLEPTYTPPAKPAPPRSTTPHPDFVPPPPPVTKEVIPPPEEIRHRRPAATARSEELNGWFLAVIIGAIVISAFGAGFLIVRPFLPSR